MHSSRPSPNDEITFDPSTRVLTIGRVFTATLPATGSTLSTLGGAETFTGNKIFTGTVSLSASVTMSHADIYMTALPTSDPVSAGKLWANSGVVTVSAG